MKLSSLQKALLPGSFFIKKHRLPTVFFYGILPQSYAAEDAELAAHTARLEKC